MAQTTNLHNNTINKSLSIQINLSGLSFSILNQESQTVETLESITFSNQKTPETLLDAVKHEFNNNLNLNQTFTSVTIIHQNTWLTNVPKALFKEDCITDYLKYNIKILANDFIAFDTVTNLDLKTVYVPYQSVNNYIYDQFGDFIYKHSNSILLESLANEEKHKEDKTVYLNIEATSFDIVIFKEGNLLLSNSFEYTTAEDFIYYVLFTFEQLQLNPETTNTLFLGKITEQDTLFKQAYTYIRHVSIFEPKYMFNFENQPLQKHYHFNLIQSL